MSVDHEALLSLIERALVRYKTLPKGMLGDALDPMWMRGYEVGQELLVEALAKQNLIDEIVAPHD